MNVIFLESIWGPRDARQYISDAPYTVYRTEDDLGETLTRKHPKANATNRPTILYQGQSLMLGIEHEPETKDHLISGLLVNIFIDTIPLFRHLDLK